LSPFWRREKPLHEQLAEKGGLAAVPGEETRDVAPWHQAGIHGVPRPREYDAVVSVDVAGVRGDELSFVALEDGTLLLESEEDFDLDPYADALDGLLAPPYRATAVRKGESTWAVAANSIQVATIEDEVEGDTVELAYRQGETTLHVDGAEMFGSLASFEDLAEGLDAYVVRASRLDGDLWELKVTPL
jgi:hypothetical protein